MTFLWFALNTRLTSIEVERSLTIVSGFGSTVQSFEPTASLIGNPFA